MQATRNWEAMFSQLKVQGFGDFYLKDKFLLLKTPFINDCEIWKGIIEGLLNVQLETRNYVPPLVFEIIKPTSSNCLAFRQLNISETGLYGRQTLWCLPVTYDEGLRSYKAIAFIESLTTISYLKLGATPNKTFL
jgi:hypothetical protein